MKTRKMYTENEMAMIYVSVGEQIAARSAGLIEEKLYYNDPATERQLAAIKRKVGKTSFDEIISSHINITKFIAGAYLYACSLIDMHRVSNLKRSENAGK